MELQLDLDALKHVLRNGPPLRLAVLFGSAARGELRPTSDLDIAFWPVDPRLPFGAEADLQTQLELASRRRVDLVRLDQASTLLLGQVARDGRPLLESRPGEFRRFQASAIVEYLDFLPLYDAVSERFRQHLIALGARHR